MSYDLYAEVKQSTSDKIIDSVSYPFTVLEHSQSFPGCPKIAGTLTYDDDAPFYKLTKEEMRSMLVAALKDVRESRESNNASVSNEIFSFAGSIIQQAKHVIEIAEREADEYEGGPDLDYLKAIVEGGIENLANTLGDWGMYVWSPYLRVVVETKPRIGLESPRINLNDIEIKVTATGEVWSKFPWLNCYRLCTKWEKVTKCERIASITVSVKIKAEAHAELTANGPIVIAKGVFDKLRLNYDILDKIPFEGIANKKLSEKLVRAFDASKFVTTVPLLESKFAVGSLSLPPCKDGINVEIELKQA